MEPTELPPTVEAVGDPRGKDATWKLMPVDTSQGQCSQCGRPHDPANPHDKMSLHYQYSFYAEHNRWPSWVDAMAHCSDEMKEMWTDALKRMGVDIDAGRPEEIK